MTEQVIISVSQIKRMNNLQIIILNDVNTMLCPIEKESNTIELKRAHFFLLGLRLTLC